MPRRSRAHAVATVLLGLMIAGYAVAAAVVLPPERRSLLPLLAVTLVGGGIGAAATTLGRRASPRPDRIKARLLAMHAWTTGGVLAVGTFAALARARHQGLEPEAAWRLQCAVLALAGGLAAACCVAYARLRVAQPVLSVPELRARLREASVAHAVLALALLAVLVVT